MQPFYHSKPANQEYYESEQEPIEIVFNYQDDRLALPAYRPAMTRSLADRLTVDVIKNPIRFISVTLAGVAQTLFGSGVKPQVKTISKKLVKTLTN